MISIPWPTAVITGPTLGGPGRSGPGVARPWPRVESVLEADDEVADDGVELLGLLPGKRDEEAGMGEATDEDSAVEEGMLDEVNTLEEVTLDKDGKIDEDIRVLLLLVTTVLDSVEDILIDDDTSCKEETGVLLLGVMLLLSAALLGKADEP
ncbi:hypothetical protein LTS18_014971 [Coniosporium uncinatum]|uniref:Uncharacterized protein n=1 Tax=Coniosporium uncinatum TaxID=93489 RepID=A0ACC3DYB5_9PEZI|nr:hypothetical protein LTS18_014971 [Coniosporium uncinatum]